MSESLQPHGPQHARLPHLSLSPKVCSNLYALSQWCHPTISSSVTTPTFSSWFQFFPASGSFPMSQFFASGGQSIGVSVSALILPMNIQDWFPLGLTGLISSLSKGLKESSPTPQFTASTLWCLAFFKVQLSHLCMTTGKTIVLTMETFVSKMMFLLFNTLSRFVNFTLQGN